MLLHIVCPDGQLDLQVPPTHASVPVHTLPHIPQFDGSLFRLTQVVGLTVGQAVCPVPQTEPHFLAVQNWPAMQALPQLPQLAGSLLRFAQVVPLQRVSPTVQTRVQWLATQD
jgi:hypothetical protein